jgi:succinate dehydrogenase / fumarate reductase, flavoprotein subunit
VFEHNLGIDGKPMVYLDLTHIDRKILDKKLEGILEIYEKFVGDDPRDTPMKIFPGMHYTMGGLWVDFKQADEHSWVFAAGECEYQYHGANRLGANSLVSCIYGGGIAGPNAVKYARGLQALPDGNGCFDAEKKRQEEINSNGLMNNEGTENPFKLWRELGELMTKDCTVIRYNKNCSRRTRSWWSCWSASQDEFERQDAVGEYDGGVCAAALQHAAVVAGDCAGRGHAG